MSKWTDDYLEQMNNSYSNVTYKKTKPEEPGFIESAWGNFKGGVESAVSGLANFAGANLKAAASNPYLNKWLSAKGLEAQGQAISNTGYNGPDLYQPVTEDNPTPYKETIQKNADALLNEGAYLDTLAQENMRKYGPRDTYGGLLDRVTNWDYWTDPRGAIADISQGVGSSLPMIGASVIVPGSGIAARAGAGAMRGAELLSGITGKKIASEAIGKGIGGALEQGIKWGLGGGSAEAVMDAGSIYSDLKKQGLNDAQIASRINDLALSEAPYLMASDALTGGLITGKIGNVLKNNKYLGGNNWYKAAARNITVGLPLNMAGEYATEMKQQQLQNEFTGKPYGTFFNPLPEEEQAGASGAIGALGFGGLGAVRAGVNRAYNTFNNINTMNTPSEPAIEENTNTIPAGVENANAWRAAQIAANDIGRPDLTKYIYSQWALETGRFTAGNANRTNNFAGLKRTDTTANELQSFDSIEDFAHEYAKQTLSHYDLSNVRNGKDFAQVLYNNGYFSSDPNQYGANIESIANEIDDTGNAGGITLPDKKYYNVLGEVSDTGLTSLTEQKLNLLARDFYNKFGYNLDVTSMKRNGDGTSWHDSGQAIDVANDLLANDPQARAWLIEQGEKYGLVALDEYTNPSANATGGHVHFSDHGDPIPGLSNNSGSKNEINIENSTARDFYNNTDYSINDSNVQDLQAEDIELSSPATAQNTSQQQTVDNLSEETKWNILDEEIEKANTEGDIIRLDKLEKIRRNKDIPALNNLIKDLSQNNNSFLQRLQLNQAQKFTPEQQAELDRLEAKREQLIDENNTLEAMRIDEQLKTIRSNFMMDNAFRGGNKQKTNSTTSNKPVNKPVFNNSNLQKIGNDMLQQMQHNNIPTANYEALQTAINSNDINKQRDAITAMQMQNNTFLNSPLNKARNLFNEIGTKSNPNYIPMQQTPEQVSNKSQNISPKIETPINNQIPLQQKSIQEMVDDLSNELSANLNDDYVSGNRNGGRIKRIYNAIQNAQQYEDFINSLSEEERLFMDYLDYTFENTGKSFNDILEGLRQERQQDISTYIEILRSQMKKGVTPRSVAYNRETGEYTNLPGFSNNYQWYRDMMQINNYKAMNKQDTENYLYDTALEHLRYGYIDPQYGEQIPQEVTVVFNNREDAINGLENIARKAIRYEQGRQLQTKNTRGNASSNENIRQEQKIDYNTAQELGKLLYNKIQEKQLKVDLENLNTAINSENTEKQEKAINFMQRKLDSNLNADEKRELADSISKLKQIKQENTTQTKEEQQILGTTDDTLSEEQNNTEDVSMDKKQDTISTNEKEQEQPLTEEKVRDNLKKIVGQDIENKATDSIFQINNDFIKRTVSNTSLFKLKSRRNGYTDDEYIKAANDIKNIAENIKEISPFNENNKIYKAVNEISLNGKIVNMEIRFKDITQKNDSRKRFLIGAFLLDKPTKNESEGTNNEPNDSTSGLDTRNSQGNNKNTVGENDASGQSSGRGRQSIQSSDGQGIQPRDISSVYGRSTDIGGTTSDSAVRTEKPADKSNSTRNNDLSRGSSNSSERQTNEQNSTKRTIEPTEKRPNNEIEKSLNKTITNNYEQKIQDEQNEETVEQVQTLFNEQDLEQQQKPKVNNKDFKAGNLESIKKDLPYLLPEQQDDVLKAENRLLNDEKTGILFTNGTGTGKTFTGLGIIKRFVNQGKGNILIVAPRGKIISDWKKSAKDFFGLNVKQLNNTENNGGNSIVITTFSNMGKNRSLVNRNWDLIVVDESHYLMSNKIGTPTKALIKLRALTFHKAGFYERTKDLHAKEYDELDALRKQIAEAKKDKKDVTQLKQQEEKLSAHLSDIQREAAAEWQQIRPEDKPKTVFLSATPFQWVKDIDYAEGYLFDYENLDDSAYNAPSGYQDFFIKNFGYSMKQNRLESPEADVDLSIMEVQFHEQLKKSGALTGRNLTIDKDYDRGFILVDGGVGKKIDKGFEYLLNNGSRFRELTDYLYSQYDYFSRMYLLEAVKAQEAITLINKYLDTGKKVVVFHNYKKGGSKHPFKIDMEQLEKDRVPYMRKNILKQYEVFSKERPDLVNLNLNELKSPIETLTSAFGDKIVLFNGDVSESERQKNADKFNKDDSNINIILVQSDAGREGISLHDRTGKHQRVLINLGLPTKPAEAIQTEGRIYRVGQKTNAIFRYLNTGTDIEREAFASKIAQRASTVENLALGEDARNLKMTYVEAFQDTIDSDEWKKYLPGSKNEGTGGKAKDYANKNNLTDFDKAKTYYFAQQKKTGKNKSAEGKDYFATPEPVGLKMVEWANLKDGEAVLEPSSGHGAIARWFSSTTKNVAVEPSKQLSDITKMNFDGTVINDTFENYKTINKFNAVVMNPPFGKGGKTAIDHVAKAFKHLRDGGRIVTIIPDGPSCQKHLDKWLESKDGENAIVIKEIKLPSSTFSRAGTSALTKILIIDKQEYLAGKEAAKLNITMPLDLSNAENINELFDRIENIEIPDRVDPIEAQQSSAKEKQNNIKNEIIETTETTSTENENTVNETNASIPKDINTENEVQNETIEIPNVVPEIQENIVDNKPSVETISENLDYVDQVIEQLKPFREVSVDLSKYRDEVLMRNDALEKINSNVFNVAWNRASKKYTVKVKNPLLMRMTVKYEAENLINKINKLSEKNNGYLQNANYGYGQGRGEFFSPFKSKALLDADYNFSDLNDLKNFLTDIGELYNNFKQEKFIIRKFDNGIYVYITDKAGIDYNAPIGKIAKQNGSDTDLFNDPVLMRGNVYSFDTKEQAEKFIDDIKKYSNDNYFTSGKTTENGMEKIKVSIRKNFSFRNILTDVDRHKKIKAIVTKYGGSYNERNLYKNTDYYFDTQEQAEKFMNELKKIASQKEYTDIEAIGEDIEDKNLNNYFELSDFKHTKTGEILKRAKPTRQFDDFIKLSNIAKKHGGRYSRFKIGNQSVGFLFKTEEQRQAFIDDVSNNYETDTNKKQDIKNVKITIAKRYMGLNKDAEQCAILIKVPLSNKHYINEIKPVLQKKDKYKYKIEKTDKNIVFSSGIKIIFKDGDNAQDFIDEVEERIRQENPDIKYSGMGQMIPSLVNSDNFISEDNLTKEEQSLSDFGNAIGCPVLFFNNPSAKNIRGAFSGGIIYLNRASDISPRWTFYHEFTHWLRYSNPDIFAEIRSTIGAVSAKNIIDYRNQIVGGNDIVDGRQLLTDEDVIEEMIADKMFNTSTRVQINRLMAENNPSLWQRFVAFWKNILDRFRALYAIPAGLDKTQTQSMNDAMERLVTSIKDIDGNILFKRTKDGLVFANTNEPLINNSKYIIKPISAESYSASEQNARLSSSATNEQNRFINKMKVWWEGKQSTSKPIQIKQALETLSGYTFESGRIEGSVQNVVINHVAKIIRTRKAFDYPAMLKGISPVLAEKLGFRNDVNMQNYIANYIFDVGSARQNTFMFNKLTAAIDKNNLTNDFIKVQNLFEDLKAMSAKEKFRDMRVNKDTVPGRGLKKLIHDTYMKQHDQWIDRYGPVQRMVEQFEKATGQKLQYVNPYKQFRLMAGSAGLGMSFVEGKKGTVNKALQELFPNIDFRNFKSLETILKDNGITADRENMEILADYAIAMYNRDNPETIQGIISNADINSIISNTPENIRNAHREIMDYQQKLFEIMADAGLISRQQLKEFSTKRRNYVPMYKYFNENDDLMFQQNPDNEESTNRLTVNPIEGIIANTYKTMRVAAKNKAKISLTTLANSKDIAPYTKIERVSNTGESTKTTFSVMINGKKQTYKTSKEIVDMMNEIDFSNLHGLKKLLYKMTTIIRAVSTFANPEFGFSNAFRDITSALYYNKYKMSPADIVYGFSSFFHKDKYYWEYMASGAAQTAAVSIDRNYTQASIDKLYKNSWKSLAKYKKFLPRVINAFQYVSEASEIGIRIGYYRSGLRAMEKDKSLNRQDVAYATRDLMDFSRYGKAGKDLNMYTAFANASIQGWSKFFRDVQSYGFAGALGLLFKIFKYAIAPTILMFLINKDDDKYKELPQWVRDTHWVVTIGDKILRIPKSMEPSIILVSSMIERGLNYSFNKDKEAFNKSFDLFLNQFPNLLPTGAIPIIETLTNYSFFRQGKIVPAAKERDMPYMQYDEYTSGASKIIGKIFNISPMKVDYVLYGYTGNFGRIINTGLDAFVIPKKYARTIGAINMEDVILLRRFMYTPYKNTRSLTQFYEDYNYQNALYNEYKDTGVKPEEFNERYYEKLKDAQKEMRDIKIKQQEIMDDTSHSASYRQSALDKVNLRRLNIARKALRYKP